MSAGFNSSNLLGGMLPQSWGSYSWSTVLVKSRLLIPVVSDESSLHKNLKYTMESNNENLSFLDVLVYKQGGRINTDIFYKDTDTNQYLNFKSCHPKHTKTNIPYCLARRICSIVSDETRKKEKLLELEEFLKRQDYPRGIIQKGIEKAKSLSIAQLRSPKEQTENDNALPLLVITHNPNNPQIINKIKRDIEFVKNSEKMKEILNNRKLIVSRRQPKNLKRELTQARFLTEKVPNTVKKCGDIRCGTCDVIKTGDSIKLKNKKVWHIKSPMDCKSKNVIYIILCPNCESFYVGQTEHLRKRVTLHKEQIKHEEYRCLSVSKHIEKCSGGNFMIMPIYQCDNANRLARESKERDIITFLQPDLNSN